MQELLRWLASVQGIEVEPGSRLAFELSSWPESGGLALLAIAALVAALGGVIQLYRRDGRSVDPAPRALLAGLRGLALLLVATVLFEPNLVVVKVEKRPGHTLLLVDTSQSMGQVDTFRREEVQLLREAWSALGVANPPAATRLDLVRALVGTGDQRLIRELAERNKLLVYGFGSGLEPMPFTAAAAAASGEAAEVEPPPRLDLAGLRAEGRHTNPGAALRRALERSRGSAVAGVVLLSDGRRNLGPQGGEIARLLAQRKVPHTLVLGVGDPSETQSVRLSRLEAPEKVFRRDPFRVSVVVASQGYEPIELEVRLLRQATPGGEGELLQTRRVSVGGTAPDAEVEFEDVTAAEVGPQIYAVEVQPPAEVPFDPERHVARTRVEVLGEQTKVLLIAGGPSHEYRILRNTLTRDKTVELRCWLLSADADFPQDGNVSIDALPTDRAAISELDVIVLMDPDSSRLDPSFCALVAQHVLEGGAGLWWVCGEKFSLDALRDTASTGPLADLLPVDPDLVRADRRVIGFGHAFERAWPYELTAEGRDHKITRLVDPRELNAQLWPQLAGYHFAFPVLRARPAASTLVEVTDPELLRGAERPPLLALQYVGAGRTLFSGTDETYRWRSLHEDAYNRFWVKGIRFLFEGRLTVGNSRTRIRVDEEIAELGEPVVVTVESRDEAYRPAAGERLELRLAAEGQVAQSVPLAPVEAVPGEFQATLRPGRTGFYTLTATASGGQSPASVSFQVVPATIEREGPVDLADLQAIANVPGGELFRTPQELLGALDRIPSLLATDTFRTPHAIWDTWATVLSLLTLLALEWWLRKWCNLL